MNIIFETARAIVREFEADDAETLYSNHLEAEMQKWIPNESYQNIEEAKEAISFYSDCVRKNRLPFVLAVVLKSTGELIGDTGINEVEGKPGEVEIGYSICSKASGRGLATELVEAMTVFACKYFDTHTLYGRVLVGNEASEQVLRNNGYEFQTKEMGAEDDPYGAGMLVYRKEMIFQEVDGVSFKMREFFDFSFLKKYGKVFEVFDDQDSGNICFGIADGDRRLFVKYAGAPTAEYHGSAEDAVARLKATVPIYENLHHDNLIQYIASEEIGSGYAVIFRWADGECMGRMYPESHRRIMALPIEEKIGIFNQVMEFMISVKKQGYQPVDFYDGSIMYDAAVKKVTICDIDYFRKSPAVNDMGQMWGSGRFMAPEEYILGADLDERTCVFLMGRVAFSLFTDSDYNRKSWPLGEESYQLLTKACTENKAGRYATLLEMYDEWKKSVL